MNVALTKELERVVKEQVRSGLYADADEVIRNAIRQTYCTVGADADLDSLENAEKVRHARRGKYVPAAKTDLDLILQRVISKRSS